MRIFRIELRRSIAPWAGLALIAVTLGFLFLLTGPWWKAPAALSEQTTTAAVWLRFTLVFGWPIAVGAGAIQGMRDGRSGMPELLSTVSRPAWQRAARLAGAVGLLTAVGFLLSFVAIAVAVAAHGGLFTGSFVPLIVVGVLAVLAGTWFGLAVGRLLPHPLTAPALSVVALTVSIMSWSAIEFGGGSALSVRAGLLAPALAEARNAFVTPAAGVDIGQAVWFTGLAATGFLLLSATSVRGRLLGLLPAVLAAAVALPLFPSATKDILTVDTAAAREVCAGPVCVSRLHAGLLPALFTVGTEALGRLAALPDAPTRIVEWTGPDTDGALPARAPGVVYIDFQHTDDLGRISPDDVRGALLAGAGVPSCVPVTEIRLSDTAARMISAAYFTGRLALPYDQSGYGLGPELGSIQAMWAKFQALPADVRRSRIIAMRQDFLTCQGNPLTALLPEAGQ